MQLLAKLKIGTKLTLLVIPPIILSLFLVGRDSLQELQTAKEAEKFTASVELIGDMERLIHEIQEERRLSDKFIREGKRQLSSELILQRKLTDREIAVFSEHIKNAKSYSTNVEREVKDSAQIVRQLASLRERVNLTAVEAETVDFLFNRLLSNPNAVVQSIEYDAPTKELSDRIEAYLFLTKAIDIAQLERENLAIFVDRNLNFQNLSEVRVQLLTDLANQEALALRGFSANITSETKERYESFLIGTANRSIQEFRNYTAFTDRLLRNSSQNKQWLTASENRIEELRLLARDLDDSIIDLASRSSTAALRHFWQNLLVSAMIICLCSLLIYNLRRKIVQPLQEVTQAAQSLSRGEIPENVTYRGEDELGEVAESFRALQQTLQTFSREIEEPHRALQRGDFSVRGNVNLFTGIWRYLVEEIDRSLDLFALVNEKLRQEADKQATISRLGALALESPSTRELGDSIVAEITRGFHCDLCEIYLFKNTERELTCSHSNREETKGKKLASEVILSDCAQEIEPLDPEYQSSILIPIPSSIQTLGSIVLQDSRPQFFAREDFSWLQSIAQILANALQRQNSEASNLYQTLHDRLTNLPNRLFLERELRQCLELDRGQTALIFFDLDRFNLINNSYGHAVGDSVLVTVVDKLKNKLQPQDLLIRFGIDEFVIVCKQIPSYDYPQILAQQIAQLFQEPCQIEELNLYLSVSMGIAYSSQSCSEPNRLLQEADMAMYQAKQQMGIAISTFDDRLYNKVLRRLELEYLLRKARENEELFVQYQPIVSLQDEKIVSYEALLLWQHPEYGFISPAEFIPVAEETGQILDIGDFVLYESIQKFQNLSQSVSDWHSYVAVNVSVHQLFTKNLPQKIANLLTTIGLDPQFLCLEVTESAVIQNIDEAVETLKQIQAMGIRLALDDFGTGYSSFSYLTRLPLDIVKIDRSFVANLGKADADIKIISAIVNMARELGLKVIAEGVETEREATILKSLGCDRAQGYLFGKPRSI